MMIVMYSKSQKPADRKQATHERIVEVASRAIRRSGFGGAGVADVMKEAGLTHGGFYAHFGSRDDLLAEAGGRACDDALALASRAAAAAPPGQALGAIVNAYMSPQHIASVERGCPISALGSELPRQTLELRQRVTAHIKRMVNLVARQFPDMSEVQANEKAMSAVCTLIGTTMVARAVDDPAFSAALCDATTRQLAPDAG